MVVFALQLLPKLFQNYPVPLSRTVLQTAVFADSLDSDMVVPPRIELRRVDYESTVLPLNYRTNGGEDWNWTSDWVIFSHPLYQLSYFTKSNIKLSMY